jgi:DNA-binding transcriptional regulator YhcF (GntR family)
VEDDTRPGRPFRDDFLAIVSGDLERNPCPSCREIAKDLLIPKIIISRVLDKIDSRFVIARWMPHK